MCEPCNSEKGKSQQRVRECQGTWVQKKSGNFAKKMGGQPEGVSQN